MKKITVLISGMHCRSCELVLEEEIKTVPGVQKVFVSQKKANAEILYDGTQPDTKQIEAAVVKAGYAIGENKKRPFFSRKGSDYYELLGATSVVLILFAFARAFGLFDSGFAFGSSPSLAIVLLVGLTAGVSTCMALVGGLVLAISARHAELHPEATRAQKFRPHLFFNLGRIIGYAFLGGLIGLVGSAFQFSSSIIGGLIIVAGALMLFLGIKLIGIFPRLEGAVVTLPKGIARLFGVKREVKEYSHRGAWIAGALTFFVPCGFTQAMQIYAMSTGSFWQGAGIMAAFALGTAPGILGVGGLASILRGTAAKHFFRFVGVAVIALGALNIANGYNLTGATVFDRASEFTNRVESIPEPYQPSVTSGEQPIEQPAEKKVQIVRMTQKPFGYVPNRFTIKKNVPVRWIINSENQYTCASFLVMPSLGIRASLQEGENIIEFTPTKSGPLKFSCSMGMYTGVFNVIN
ncbi:MAG: sulfite exporter TauE/SafE family protein [bacterium]|nr:sulfite exporter TauE/SafE family protein [bacterium]